MACDALKGLPEVLKGAKNRIKTSQHTITIPPTRFELVSPDPKSCMIDRYTTGVDDVIA